MRCKACDAPYYGPVVDKYHYQTGLYVRATFLCKECESHCKEIASEDAIKRTFHTVRPNETELNEINIEDIQQVSQYIEYST